MARPGFKGLSHALGAIALSTVGLTAVPAAADAHEVSPVPRGAIKHVMVIDFENEAFSATFGPSSVARYLNDQLVPRGQLLTNYYATGHVTWRGANALAPTERVSLPRCIVDDALRRM